MWFSNQAFVLIALLTFVTGDVMKNVQAEDEMPSTIDIVCQLRTRAKNEYISVPVRIENVPIPGFYIRGAYGEEKGYIHPVSKFVWSLRRTPGLLPDKRLLQVGGNVRGLDERERTSGFLKEGQLVPICGHVYRFSRKDKAGLLTLLTDHPLEFNPKDKARYFSVSGGFNPGYAVARNFGDFRGENRT